MKELVVNIPGRVGLGRPQQTGCYLYCQSKYGSANKRLWTNRIALFHQIFILTLLSDYSIVFATTFDQNRSNNGCQRLINSLEMMALCW
jgi:hypothetical protein